MMFHNPMHNGQSQPKAGGFAARAHGIGHAGVVLGVGSAISALGAYALGWNLWRTLDQAAIPPARPAAPRQMPVVERPGMR